MNVINEAEHALVLTGAKPDHVVRLVPGENDVDPSAWSKLPKEYIESKPVKVLHSLERIEPVKKRGRKRGS